MSENLRVGIEIIDERHVAHFSKPVERRIEILIEMPTGEGSPVGPNLEADDWEDALSTLVQRVASAARSCLADPEAERAWSHGAA